MINVTADTKKFEYALYGAAKSVQSWEEVRHHMTNWNHHKWPPDWESRLWELASKLAVAMCDRCQEGLMTPEEFGKLSVAMASWTVNAAVELRTPKTKPLTQEDLQKFFGGHPK